VDHNGTQDTTPAGHGYGGSDAPRANSARTIAIVAIVIALTAPFWEGALLGSINIHMPMARELATSARELDRLDRRTAELEQQLGTATAQLGKLQTQVAEAANRANAAVERTATLAMVQLSTALRRSGGFELELAAFRAAVPDQGGLKPLLDQIEAYAVTGVPSSARVKQELDSLSYRIRWSGRGYLSVAWVTHILPWQRSANAAQAAQAAPQVDTPRLLSQADTQVGNGELSAALATVQAIAGVDQEVLADWMEDAKARIAADAVAQRLEERVSQHPGQTAQKPSKT
jgi:hypothetical protein